MCIYICICVYIYIYMNICRFLITGFAHPEKTPRLEVFLKTYGLPTARICKLCSPGASGFGVSIKTSS